MADDNNIVTNVTIGGVDEAKKTLEDFGKTGEEAFNSLSEGAKRANESMENVVNIQSKGAGITPEEFKRRGQAFGDYADRPPPKSDTTKLNDESSSRQGSSTENELRKALKAIQERPNGGIGSALTAAGVGAGAEALAEGGKGPTSTIKNFSDTFKGALSKINSAVDDLAAGGGKAGGFFSTFSSGAEHGNESAQKFRETIHVLRPALDEVGVGVGKLGEFARLAGAGMQVLGLAIAGTVVAALAKLSDEADKSKRRLDLLSGAGKGGGESQAENVKKLAKDLGVDPSDISSGAETFFKAQQNTRASDRTVTHPPNFVSGPSEESSNNVQVLSGRDSSPSNGLTSDTITTAIKATVEAGRADRSSAKESIDALKDLYSSTKGGKGPITVDALDKLPPAIADAVAKAASGSGAGGTGQNFAGAPELRAALQRGTKLTGDQVLTGLARTEPALKTQADAIPPNIGQSLEHLESAAKHLAETLSGDLGIANAFEKLAKWVDDFVGDHTKEKPAQSLGEVYSSDKGDLLGRLVGYLRGQNVGDKIVNGPEALRKSPAETFPEVTKNLEKLLRGDFSNAYAPEKKKESALESGEKPVSARPQTGVSPLDYDRTSDGLLIKRTEQPTQLEKRSDVPQPNQQVADLGTQFQSLLATISAALTKPQQDLKQTGPADSLGVRGEGAPPPATDITKQFSDLGAAAEDAASKLRGINTESNPPVTAAEGGHIRGAGTSTSDSIPAMLSDGEYVVNADAVKKAGVHNLDAINAGKAHFADGGQAKSFPPVQINGVYHFPRSQQEYDALIKNAKDADDEAQREYQARQSRIRSTRHKSDFVGRFGGTSSAEDQEDHYSLGGFVRKLATGGLVGNAPSVLQHFNTGGLASRIARATAPTVGYASGGVARSPPSAPAATEMDHWGTIDMRSDHGDFKVATERDTMRHLSSSAQKAKRYSTGSKPGWYGGGQ